MEGRQTAGWVVALAGSLAIHVALIGFFAVPSIFSGGDGAELAAETPPPAPDRPTGVEVPSKPSPSADAEPPKKPDAPAQAGPSKTSPERPKAKSPSPRPAAPAAGEETAPAAGDEAGRPDFHIVRQGDTITKIAKDYGMTPEEIARINGKPLKRLNNIWVGQKIKLK